MVKTPRKIKKPRKDSVYLAEHDIATMRMKWCGGLESQASIADEFGIPIQRLVSMAKRLKWEKTVFKDGTRPYDRKDLVIRGVKVAYIGPLTPEERVLVSAATADVVHASIEPHRHASYMAILLVNQYLAKLIANDGMEERIILPKKIGDEPIKMLIPGQDQLLTLAKILGYVVPIDRQAIGLDDKPGAAGANQAEEREKLAKATADAIMGEFASRWSEKLSKVQGQAMITNGHANGSNPPGMVPLPPSASG